MRKEIIVDSNMFDDCGNCQTARDYGRDEISTILAPSVENPNPANPSVIVTRIECKKPIGDKRVTAYAETKMDGKTGGWSTGPINCPVVNQ